MGAFLPLLLLAVAANAGLLLLCETFRTSALCS
jgi:hypothetical protein